MQHTLRAFHGNFPDEIIRFFLAFRFDSSKSQQLHPTPRPACRLEIEDDRLTYWNQQWPLSFWYLQELNSNHNKISRKHLVLNSQRYYKLFYFDVTCNALEWGTNSRAHDQVDHYIRLGGSPYQDLNELEERFNNHIYSRPLSYQYNIRWQFQVCVSKSSRLATKEPNRIQATEWFWSA